jgi:hypothetical protein
MNTVGERRGGSVVKIKDMKMERLQAALDRSERRRGRNDVVCVGGDELAARRSIRLAACNAR